MSVDTVVKKVESVENNNKASPMDTRTTPPNPTNNAEDNLETRFRMLEEQLQVVKESEATLKQQYADSQRRERLYQRRLASKEQEMQDYMLQISEYKAAQAPTTVVLRNGLLDPAVNILFQKMKQELQLTKAKLEETQNELAAWKFTPDSNTGKRLMAKCRLLYQENEELGKMTSNGRLAKLEASLSCHRTLYEEVKKSQSEIDDFLQEIDEDVEGMQSTILFLQQELKTVRDENQHLKQVNQQLTNGESGAYDTANGTIASSINGVESSSPYKTAPLNGTTAPLNSATNNDDKVGGGDDESIVRTKSTNQSETDEFKSNTGGTTRVKSLSEIMGSDVGAGENGNGVDSASAADMNSSTESNNSGAKRRLSQDPTDSSAALDSVAPKRTRRTAAIVAMASIESDKKLNGVA